MPHPTALPPPRCTHIQKPGALQAVKDVLAEALVLAGMVPVTTDASLAELSAQQTAKLLASGSPLVADDDAELRTARGLAARIADGDDAAARRLLAARKVRREKRVARRAQRLPEW